MILFIRDKKNNTIVDCDISYKSNSILDMHVTIGIEPYSVKLLQIEENEKKIAFIKEIDDISELRGWLHESYLYEKPTSVYEEEYQNIINIIKKIFLAVCKEYDLYYVED